MSSPDRPISRDEAKDALQSGDRERLCDALLRLALHDPDRAWLEKILLRFLAHPDDEVRGAAAVALGHVARLHHDIDVDQVVPALKRLLLDPVNKARAEDALDDIGVHVKRKPASGG